MFDRLLAWARRAMGSGAQGDSFPSESELLDLPRGVPEEPGGDEIDQMHAWSISARLASLPEGLVEALPEEVAALVREAKAMHPSMTAGHFGAADRVTQAGQMKH